VPDPFVHLHVASGYSLRHGASTPAALVGRAVDHGMDALALTDRDGAYGAVKFVTACVAAGVRPLLGVVLAIRLPEERVPARRAPTRHPSVRRTPARGGTEIDPRLPRVVLVATNGRGWASLCRLVSATHLAGERGRPVITLDLVAEHARGLAVLLGPDSDVGRALARRRPDHAAAALDRWRGVLRASTGESPDLTIEVVCHRGRGDAVRAARLLGFAADAGVGAVLTNVVRGADRDDGPTLDVLDATRRLVPLDARHVDRVTAEAYLKSGKEMAEVAEDVVAAAAMTGRAATDLLAATRRLADRCALDPRADLGMGVPHLPDLAMTGGGPDPADVVLRQRCEAGFGRRGMAVTARTQTRLDAELTVIRGLRYPTYFLTIADIVAMVKDMGVRCAARGSGAGSLVTYLLGISDIDPIEHRLLMERFLSPSRRELPDIDLDVESSRRIEVYERIFTEYGSDRCTCVSMMDTYRARHAIRDVGAALGLPAGEIDALATAFPHIRANQVRAALRELPELRASGFARVDGGARLDLLLRLVERLDGLPRHIAMHPCGILISDRTLLDRTPVEASGQGFPMSEFDKDDVEALGLLKLDVLGIRMQSAIAHALGEVRRVDGEVVDIDGVRRDDPATFDLIRSTRTLGCFQIESPGQRELIGKFGPETFGDLIIDISLFRPGPVKSDMIRPFLEVRQGWASASYLHPDLREVLEETCGVVVFHEQVLEMVHVLTGCSLAEADEVRRALGDPAGHADMQAWFIPAALRRGYDLDTVQRAWEVLKSFGSFGFCKAHAAAFALPTYQSAWLKTHHAAAFLAGVLTHDPGMYPKRLILDDARQFGITILPLDVNVCDGSYRIEVLARLDEPPPAILDAPPEPVSSSDRRYGIRLSLADVKGITDAEIAAIVTGRPYASLSDFWHRAAVSRPVVERLVLAGGFDAIYGIGATLPVRRRGQVSRRDLLLQVAELSRGVSAAPRARARAGADRSGGDQLVLDLGDAPVDPLVGGSTSGLAELTAAEQVRAELEVLGLDATRHVLSCYEPFLATLPLTRARDLVSCRTNSPVLMAGVKVATQTPPIRSGRRVVFVTLDDSTGPLDATFFDTAQTGYAATLFHSWLLVVRGTVRRTGPRGVSINATACWDLTVLRDAWEHGGRPAVEALMSRSSQLPQPTAARGAPRTLWHASPGSSGA
jgi:error-prone DNA polymerase